MEKLTLFHGSQQIIQEPKFGLGKSYNDYGRGFYCTENIELAKEWACPIKNDGYVNKYEINIEGLNILYLTGGEFNILNWLAILLKNRTFDTSSEVGTAAKEYIISQFLPNTDNVDIIIGYRADDSYFSFAEDFVNNNISVGKLSQAMQLGKLGEQVVLISRKAFRRIKYTGSETVDYLEYYYKRTCRDQEARADYAKARKDISRMKEDVYVLDIIREEMKDGDPRLQSAISE